jgi:hypothetical protein
MKGKDKQELTKDRENRRLKEKNEDLNRKKTIKSRKEERSNKHEG